MSRSLFLPPFWASHPSRSIGPGPHGQARPARILFACMRAIRHFRDQ